MVYVLVSGKETVRFSDSNQAMMWIVERGSVDRATVEDSLTIFTDGSCTGNGRKNSLAGIGVWYGKDDPRNISEPLTESPDGKRPTNNTAELTALIRAFQSITDDQHYTVYSDSRYSIDCVEKWYGGWAKKGWKTSTGKPVKNKQLIESLHDERVKRPNVRLIHVKAHTDGTDPISIGNREADKLAVAGASRA